MWACYCLFSTASRYSSSTIVVSLTPTLHSPFGIGCPYQSDQTMVPLVITSQTAASRHRISTVADGYVIKVEPVVPALTLAQIYRLASRKSNITLSFSIELVFLSRSTEHLSAS